jgi:hypothetical protein
MKMADLKVTVFKSGEAQAETTVTFSGGVLRLAANPEINGTLVEVEEYKKNEKLVISLEQLLAQSESKSECATF